jgi:ribosomal protein S18 acetylase RimI-like enzyme
METIIRCANPSDAAALADLYLRARRAGAASRTIPASVHGDDDTRDWITHVVIATHECWLAERASGTLVGMLVLDACWIDQLSVDPNHTRRGIGAQLLTVAKRERPKGLRLWTFVSNEDAQRFYSRHGFQEVERSDGSDNEEGAPAIQYAWRRA